MSIRKNRWIFILILPLLCLRALFSQPAVTREGEEAPEAFFEAEINDAEVDFYLLGSWELSFAGTTGFAWSAESGFQALDLFPGLAPGIVFQQTPDITLSIWLMEQYFFELTYLGGDAADNQFLLGYEGKEEDFLQRLYLGNKDISISPYPYLQIPETGQSSLGLEAMAISDSGEHEILLRFDNNETVSKLFIGPNEVKETLLSPGDWQEGRFFRLPDSEVEDLVLYIQDPEGSYSEAPYTPESRKWRRAELDEVVMDSATGTITIKEENNSPLLVYYTKNGVDVGDISIGDEGIPEEDGDGYPDSGSPAVQFYFDMTYTGASMAEADRSIEIEGKRALLLWEPGKYSPFEVCNSYPLEDAGAEERWRYRVNLVEKGSDESYASGTPAYRVIPEENRFIFYNSPEADNEIKDRYPLDDPEKKLYGPEKLDNPSYPDYNIQLLHYSPVNGYFLEPDLIPGSVRVIRNGINETDFTVNNSTGVVTFQTYIHPEDRIEIFYKTQNALVNNGDLLFAWGNHFLWDDHNTLDLAMGLRWNGIAGSYSEEPYARTGGVIGSLEYQGNWDRLKIKSTAGFSLTTPDTTGYLLLAGMESDGLTLEGNEGAAFPAAPPLFSPPPSPQTCTALNRGKLFYKNYRSYGFLGNVTLQPLSWTIPDDDDHVPMDYETNSKPGPYNAYDSEVGECLVMDFELADNTQWAGIQLPLPGGIADLSTFESLSFFIKGADLESNTTVQFQLGETGEDLDGDGVLDEEQASADLGFTFNDTANSANLILGTDPRNKSNSSLDTEDRDGNGYLDKEDENNIISLTDRPLSAGTGSWAPYTYTFSEADKQKLKRSRAFRVLIKTSAAAKTTGKILIADINLNGGSFFPAITGGNDDGESFSTRATFERYSEPLPPEYLLDAFPQLEERFHGNGEIQEVLEARWSGLGTGENWKLTRYLDRSINPGHYKKLSFYVRVPEHTPEITPPDFTFTLKDSEDRGLTATFPLPISAAWQEVTIDLEKNTLTLDGEDPGALVTNTAPGSWLNKIEITYTGEGEGVLYLDEIYLHQSRPALGGTATAELEYSYPDEILTAGNTVLLSNFTLKEQAGVQTPGFSPLYSNPSGELAYFTRTSMGIDLLYTNLLINLDIQNLGEKRIISGGQTITLPAEGPVQLVDQFNRSYEEDSNLLSREDHLKIVPSDNFSFEGIAGAAYKENLFIQNWEIDTRGKIKEEFTGDLNLKFSQSSEKEYTPGANWFSEWASSFGDYLPASGPLERNSEFSSAPVLTTAPLGAKASLTGKVTAYDFEALARKNKTRISGWMELPLKLEISPTLRLLITPGYKRDFSLVTEEAGESGFTRDWALFGQSFINHPYIYNSLLIKELIDKETAEAFFVAPGETIEYSPQGYLQFSRTIGSRWYDLLLPNQLNFNWTRELKKGGDLYSDKERLSFGGKNAVLNLFGKLGVHPFFSFYLVDEFTTSYQFNWTLDEDEILHDGKVTGFASFRGEEDALFSLENVFAYTLPGVFTWQSNISFDWLYYPGEKIALPLLKDYEGDSFFVHQEKAGIGWAQNSTTSSVHPFNLLLTHTTTLRMPDFGFIRGSLSLGMDKESWQRGTDTSSIYRYALRGALEASFQW